MPRTRRLLIVLNKPVRAILEPLGILKGAGVLMV
jgi:hypothetical protein